MLQNANQWEPQSRQHFHHHAFIGVLHDDDCALSFSYVLSNCYTYLYGLDDWLEFTRD